MAALSSVHRKMVKFGALMEMVINSNLTNFEVSSIKPVAPPPVQKILEGFHICRRPTLRKNCWILKFAMEVASNLCLIDFVLSIDIHKQKCIFH